MKKIQRIITNMFILMFAIAPINVYAVGFDEAAAKALVEQFMTPLTSFLLWAVPIAAIAACLASYISWATKDDDEKEQKPVAKTIKKIIFWAIIAEMISAIFKVFGL